MKKWISRHCDLYLWSKVTHFNSFRASAVSNYLGKTDSKSVHPFGWNFIHWKTDSLSHTHTDKLQLNIPPPRFHGGVINIFVNVRVHKARLNRSNAVNNISAKPASKIYFLNDRKIVMKIHVGYNPSSMSWLHNWY